MKPEKNRKEYIGRVGDAIAEKSYVSGDVKACYQQLKLLERYHVHGKLYEVKNSSSSYAPRRAAALLEQAQKNDINQHSYM